MTTLDEQESITEALKKSAKNAAALFGKTLANDNDILVALKKSEKENARLREE